MMAIDIVFPRLNSYVLEREIFNYAYQKHKREMEILMSVPGIGELGAATLIAEIGNFSDFP